MFIAALLIATLAALLHVYIFYMESVAWTSPAVRRTFGLTEDEAAATQQMAFNQGFYNLFLAVLVFAGAVVFLLGGQTVGVTLMVSGVGSMFAAALVLLLSDRRKARAAITQGAFPLLSLIAFTLGWML